MYLWQNRHSCHALNEHVGNVRLEVCLQSVAAQLPQQGSCYKWPLNMEALILVIMACSNKWI